MKKLFCFLTTSLLLFSCSNDDQVSSNNLDQKSQNSIQKIKTEFNEEYKLIPNYEKFKNVDWDNPKVFTYGDNKKGISLKTYNTKNENEFNLLIGYNKEGEEYYFLSTDKPQELTTEDIVMKYNDKTVVYTQEIYIYNRNDKELNNKKSVRNNDKLVTGNIREDEGPHWTIKGNNGNSGGSGSYLDLDAMYELDSWSRPGGGSSNGGGGTGTAVITSPAPEYKIIIDKTFTDNSCIMAIYNKLGGVDMAKRYLNAFDNQLKAPDLTWKLESIDSKSNTIVHGQTDPLGFYNYEITINKNHIDYPLEVAGTMLHELIHATLMRWIDSVGRELTTKNFPGLFDYYSRYNKEEAQHNLMANSYVDLMVKTLKQYDSSYDNKYYEAIAWGGLEGTTDYNNLSSKKKKELKDNLKEYRNDKNKINCK